MNNGRCEVTYGNWLVMQSIGTAINQQKHADGTLFRCMRLFPWNWVRNAIYVASIAEEEL